MRPGANVIKLRASVIRNTKKRNTRSPLNKIRIYREKHRNGSVTEIWSFIKLKNTEIRRKYYLFRRLQSFVTTLNRSLPEVC